MKIFLKISKINLTKTFSYDIIIVVIKMIEDERIKKLMEITDKHQISPATMAHIIGISIPTYYRYKKGETVPRSQNTRTIIDRIIEQYNFKNK